MRVCLYPGLIQAINESKKKLKENSAYKEFIAPSEYLGLLRRNTPRLPGSFRVFDKGWLGRVGRKL